MFQNLDATHLLMEISGNSFAAAVAAYETADFVTAANLFRQLAEAEDGEAQFNLGMMLRQGQGCPKNEQEASHWLKKAEALGCQ